MNFQIDPVATIFPWPGDHRNTERGVSSSEPKVRPVGARPDRRPKGLFGPEAQILLSLSPLALGRFQHPQSVSHHGQTGIEADWTRQVGTILPVCSRPSRSGDPTPTPPSHGGGPMDRDIEDQITESTKKSRSLTVRSTSGWSPQPPTEYGSSVTVGRKVPERTQRPFCCHGQI